MNWNSDTSLLKQLTPIQKRQNWRDRALLKLVLDYIEKHTSVSWDLLTQYIQNTADNDNKNYQHSINKLTIEEVPYAN